MQIALAPAPLRVQAPLAPAPTAAPAPRVSAPVDGFERTSSASPLGASVVPSFTPDPALSAQLARGLAGAGAAPRLAPEAAVAVSAGDAASEAAARQTYDRYGDHAFDLSDPTQRDLLIAASPQVDNLASTTSDANRCGGAAMLNGVLLGGDPASGARAIEQVAAERGLAVDPEMSAALDAMKGGSLSPKQAAVLQDRLFQLGKSTADDLPPELRGTSDPKTGLNPIEMSELAGALKGAGAFGDACSVRFTMADVGDQNHWTVAVTDEAGAVKAANSAAFKDGLARTASSDLSPKPGDTNFVGDVTLEPAAGGKTDYQVRLVVDGEVRSLERTTAGAPRLWE